MNDKMINNEIYFRACEYCAKTELHDRTLTKARSDVDSTEAYFTNPYQRNISTMYAHNLANSYGKWWKDIREEIERHKNYTAQHWIDEYERLLSEREDT